MLINQFINAVEFRDDGRVFFKGGHTIGGLVCEANFAGIIDGTDGYVQCTPGVGLNNVNAIVLDLAKGGIEEVFLICDECLAFAIDNSHIAGSYGFIPLDR